MKKHLTIAAVPVKIKAKENPLSHNTTQQSLFQGEVQFLTGGDGRIDGTTLWGHQGNAYGVVSCLFYDRDTRKGVVFLNNRASQMRTESKVYAVNDAVVKAIWQYLG